MANPIRLNYHEGGYLDKNIMKYIPKSKKTAIKAAWKDSDGYWITLNKGFNASRTDVLCHTIHEDTIADLRYQIAGIEAIIE